MAQRQTVEIPIKGMDCAECALHVQQAIARLPGVESVQVLLAAEKAIVRLDPEQVDLSAIRRAVAAAGDYWVPETASAIRPTSDLSRRPLMLLGIVFGMVLVAVVAGEWLGLFRALNERVPFPIGVALVILGGWPVFRNVIRAALKGQILSHTLMTLGVIAALAVGEWVTAALLVVFMRIGDYVENATTTGARRAIRELMALAPQTARVERNGEEVEVPVTEVQVGETVIVRPGERIPVDGEVIAGQATVDQSAITGESMPVEVAAGSRVFAATIAQLGGLRVRALRVGADTTFGRVIRMVEEAEAHRAEVQRFADRFSTYYLPIVLGIAALTWLFGRNLLAVAAVLVVVCSCSIALATPVAMLAAIGGSARRGVLIKGGRYIEALARADVVLVDKTGTLTLGRPQITDILSLDGRPVSEILVLAASAERYSEHPLAEAVRAAARVRGLPLLEPEDFAAFPGLGVRARVNGEVVAVGNRRFLPEAEALPQTQQLEREGKTPLFVSCNGRVIGILAAADTL
ncbi:MAG: cation-translocating P-type ATPase, partial [Anaerolineae bacterium]|nr:cation-translocating P-type ATPase [Anaerolineae bacterium]